MTSGESARSVNTCDSKLNYLSASVATVEAVSDKYVEESSTSEDVVKQETNQDEESSENGEDGTIDWGPKTPGPDLYLPGAWGTEGLEVHPWDDTKRPVVTFQNYKDLELNEIETNGVLSDRIMASCSSYLDKSPESGKYVLCKMILSKKSLVDIRVLAYHHHLQYVDLSWNQLENVEALGQLPFLMYLDLSHNQLEIVLDFKAPLNLTCVNYSFNMVSMLRDLGEFWSIVYLDLSHNCIEEISGLQELRFLRHLNLSHNAIYKIENLNNMKLLTLNLQNNNIVSYEEGDDIGFKTLNYLLQINLDYNQLKSLKVFDGVPTLQSLNIRDNCISELIELTSLHQLNFLTEVDFRGNPIVDMEEYIDVCINNVRRITILDGEFVYPEKKVAVKNKFDPSLHTTAFKSAATSLFLQHLNDPILGLPVVPFDHPYVPIIILVGTPASNKGKLTKKLCELHSKYTINGISHTTRPKIDDTETDEYYFTSSKDFWEMAHEGEFLTVSQILGHSFALSQKELGKTVDQPRALILHMDMKGALTLRAKNSKTCLVLAMPSTQEMHTKFISEKYYNNTNGGAAVVMNCPVKAKEFLSDSENLLKTKNANVFVTQIIGDVVKAVMSEGVSELEKETDYEKSSKTSIYIENKEKVNRDSLGSEPFGILKTSHKNDPGSLPQQLNVKFHSDTKCNRYRGACAGSSRSVSFFSDLPDAPSAKESSISATVIDENEPLSVLSQTVIEKREFATEEAATLACTAQSDALKAVTADILNMREAYLQFHLDNPGLFSEVIFTDDENNASMKLTELLKRCITQQPNATASFKYKQDSAYKAMIVTRLNSMHVDINSEMSIGEKQLNDLKYYTPTGKPFDSNLQKSKQEIIDTMASHRKLALNLKLP